MYYKPFLSHWENQALLNYFWKTKTSTWQRNETSKSNSHTAQLYAVLPVLIHAHSHITRAEKMARKTSKEM